jgi:hypothetical protein
MKARSPRIAVALALLVGALVFIASPAFAATKKPKGHNNENPTGRTSRGSG